jgi:hypothetical protein
MFNLNAALKRLGRQVGASGKSENPSTEAGTNPSKSGPWAPRSDDNGSILVWVVQIEMACGVLNEHQCLSLQYTHSEHLLILQRLFDEKSAADLPLLCLAVDPERVRGLGVVQRSEIRFQIKTQDS